MKITIDIDQQLLSEATQFAISNGMNLDSVIEDAIRNMLAEKGIPEARQPIKLTTVGGKGLADGVNQDDSAGLLENMGENEVTG